MDPLLELARQTPDPHWRWAFDPERKAWHVGDAVAMANCALLSYGDEPATQARWKAWGFEGSQRVTSALDATALVAWRPDCLVVTLRGTQPLRVADWLTDVEFAQDAWPHFAAQPSCKVHHGFLTRWQSVERGVIDLIELADQSSAAPPRPIVFSGHSLGGALAVLGAAALQARWGTRLRGVYTIGQPRVGNAEFCEAYDHLLGSRTYRCVNNRDPVPHLPPRCLPMILAPFFPKWPYDHCGQLKLLLPDSTLTTDARLEAAREPTLLGCSDPLDVLGKSVSALLALELPDIRDHFPVDPLRRLGYVERLARLAAA